MTQHNLEDSGDRTVHQKDGGQKDYGSAEKHGRYDLIPPESLERLAIHYARGAKKYDDNNWKKGVPNNICIDAALRHINRWRKGSREEDHLAAAAFWLFALMYFEERRKQTQEAPF